jgi:hypothetical protein
MIADRAFFSFLNCQRKAFRQAAGKLNSCSRYHGPLSVHLGKAG